MRTRLIALLAAVLALVGTLGPDTAAPARALTPNPGGGSLQFWVNGTLSPFPGTLQTTTFSGTGSGTGTVTGIGSDGGVYTADVTILAMGVSGSAQYNEPIWPVCPITGSAVPLTGSITMNSQPGSISGVVYRAGDALTGSVVSLSTTFTFQYNRVGATASLVVTRGRTTATVAIPGHGTPTVSMTYNGAGAGAFVADPVAAEQECRLGPGSLPYQLIGDAVVAGPDPLQP
jgi:hypothetical protein